MEIFNFFKNFKKLLIGGHDEKLKNFGKSKKKFKIEIANVIFRPIFNESEIFLDRSIAQIERGFQKLGH